MHASRPLRAKQVPRHVYSCTMRAVPFVTFPIRVCPTHITPYYVTNSKVSSRQPHPYRVKRPTKREQLQEYMCPPALQ